jgi:succinate dehydrogenase/fumarate reductase flavoprotein subunit
MRALQGIAQEPSRGLKAAPMHSFDGVVIGGGSGGVRAARVAAQHVTAAFNLNLLVRANKDLGTHFVTDQFAHWAFYNAP